MLFLFVILLMTIGLPEGGCVFLFVILLVTIGLPEGDCVVSICYIVDDHWFARGWLCCFYLLYCW